MTVKSFTKHHTKTNKRKHFTKYANLRGGGDPDE